MIIPETAKKANDPHVGPAAVRVSFRSFDDDRRIFGGRNSGSDRIGDFGHHFGSGLRRDFAGRLQWITQW